MPARRLGLRATAGEGSHVTVEAAVSDQFERRISGFAKPTFDRFRRMRQAAQCFGPSAPDITDQDVAWAMKIAESVLHSTVELIRFNPRPLHRRE